MPTTMKDAEGNEVEVFTADEVKAQEEAAIAKYQEEHPDQAQALADANAAKEKAEQDLAAALASSGGKEGDTKDENIKNLRETVAATKAEVEKIKADSAAEIEALKNAPAAEYQGELLDTASQGDKELREKIAIRYNELSGMPATTKAEVRARVEAAMKLAVDNYVPGMLDGRTSMAPRGDGGMPRAGEGANESENAGAIRAALGISDDVAKKFAPKPGQPGYQA